MIKNEKLPLLLIGPNTDAVPIHYVCDFEAPDFYLVLLTGRETVICVSSMEKARAQAVEPGAKVLAFHDLFSARKTGFKQADIITRLLQKMDIGSIFVTREFPHGIAQSLLKKNISLHCVMEDIFPGRAVKSAIEIEKIARAQRAAAAAVQYVRDQLIKASVDNGGRLKIGRNVLRSEDLRKAVELMLYEQGFNADKAIIACGAQAADPHEAGHGPLYAGRPIVIDIFPQDRSTGYWGDITRTYIKGKPEPRLLAMYRAVLAAQKIALKGLKPGVKISKLHRAVFESFSGAGFETTVKGDCITGFIHSTGHGVGLEIHEEPRISFRNDERFKAGHVVTLEPGLYYPDTGGVRIEDTVAVCRGGYRTLARLSRDYRV